MQLGEDEFISRCIIYGKAFKGSMHIDNHLFRFDQSPKESLVSRTLKPDDHDVHLKGCEIAAIQNKRKNPPRGDPERRYYCGFRTARVGDITLNGFGYTIEMGLREENGDQSHVFVELTVTETDKSERNRIKAEAGMEMADAFGPAVPHICECDVGDEHHPLIINPRCLIDGLNSFAQ